MFEICRRIRFFLLVWRGMLGNDTIPYLCEQDPKAGTITDETRVNSQLFPFQKSDGYDNGSISFRVNVALRLLFT